MPNTCSCDWCAHTKPDTLFCRRQGMLKDPTDCCQDWKRPLRRDLVTGKPFEVQAINDPPNWQRIKLNCNPGKEGR